MQETTIIQNYIVFKNDEARIAGKGHLKAELVARLYVNGEHDVEYIMEQYGLTRAQVYAALTYYFENQQVLDAEYEKSWSESKAIKSADFRAEIESRMLRDKD